MTVSIEGKHVLLNARVLFGGYDFSGLSETDFDNGLDPVELTAFGNTNHVYAPGLGGAKVSMAGYTKYGLDGNEVQIWNALSGRLIKEFMISARGEIGDRAYFFRVMTAQFKGLGPVGAAEKFSLSVQAAKGEPAIPGTVLESGMTLSVVTPKTASGSSAPQNLGPVGAAQSLFAQVHCYQVPVVVTVAQIVATANNYNPPLMSTAYRLDIDLDADHDMTGLAGGSTGRVISLKNISAHALTLKDSDGGSLAANQFDLGGDHVIAAGATYKLEYNSGTSKWNPSSATFPTCIIKLQSDAAGSFLSPTDVWTFSTFGTDAGAEFKQIAGPITDTWFRLAWTIVGGGPYGFAGAAGIF